MKLDSIEKLQNKIWDFLKDQYIYPFSIFITIAVPNYKNGFCSITFFNDDQLQSFLDFIEYPIQSNKGDYVILYDSFTVLLKNIALVNLYKML